MPLQELHRLDGSTLVYSRFGASRHGTPCAHAGGVNPKAEELKERTARFAESIVRFVRELPNTMEARKIGGQLVDAGTSVASNYRAACRGRSHAEFVSKLGIVVEETDEAQGWLSLLVRCGISSESVVKPLLEEADELLRIFTASHRTATARQRQNRR